MAWEFPSRRGMIGAITACGASGFARRAMCFVEAMDCGTAAHVRAVLEILFSDLRCVAVVGRACLPALLADAASFHDLARLVFGRLPGNRGYEAFVVQVRQHIRRDFAVGNIVVIDGWTLSSTEVNLYALAALLCSSDVNTQR